MEVLTIDYNDKYITEDYVLSMIENYNENVDWLNTYKNRGNLEKDKDEIALRYQNLSEYKFINLPPHLAKLLMDVPQL